MTQAITARSRVNSIMGWDVWQYAFNYFDLIKLDQMDVLDVTDTQMQVGNKDTGDVFITFERNNLYGQARDCGKMRLEDFDIQLYVKREGRLIQLATRQQKVGNHQVAA